MKSQIKCYIKQVFREKLVCICRLMEKHQGKDWKVQMRTLKQIISRYMYMITCILVVVILVILVCIQVLTEKKRAYDDAIRTIKQIESVLSENQKDLEEIKREYRETCIHNARIVAYIIESDWDVLSNTEKLRDVARSLEVDEIHIFDTQGRIFTGTHPEYYGYTFDSGEQIQFFKPMLENKELELVQEITPNTAEGKPMQYSAIWSQNKKYIVQIGKEPIHVMKMTEKNELSHVFSHFRINPSANYYAVDVETGEIVGSTALETVGAPVRDIGIELSQITNASEGFYAKINGEWSFCVFEQISGNYVGRVLIVKNLYQRVPTNAFWIFISLLIVAFTLAKAVVRQMNFHVVKKIDNLNDKLQSIADGNLDEKLDMRSSVEFDKLSGYVNYMVNSLIENSKKMSYALSKTNIRMGTYEYSNQSNKVQYTECIPEIFSIDKEQMGILSSNRDLFIRFLDDIKNNLVRNEEGVYKYKDLYVRIEEITSIGEVFGVVVDVTAQMNRRKEIEKERDIDVLTGLYNRRGIDKRFERLFEYPEKLGYSAIIMIDADGLKSINDTYGHDKGDIYLQKIANVINNFGIKRSVASRQGGDEYVLFLYGYDSEDELLGEIEKLRSIQSHNTAHLNKEIEVPIRFSMGYCMVNNCTDYHKLIKEADKKMYQDKLERKKNIV